MGHCFSKWKVILTAILNSAVFSRQSCCPSSLLLPLPPPAPPPSEKFGYIINTPKKFTWIPRRMPSCPLFHTKKTNQKGFEMLQAVKASYVLRARKAGKYLVQSSSIGFQQWKTFAVKLMFFFFLNLILLFRASWNVTLSQAFLFVCLFQSKWNEWLEFSQKEWKGHKMSKSNKTWFQYSKTFTRETR